MEGGAQAARRDRIIALLSSLGYAIEDLTPGRDPTHLVATPA
jgi:hypothetical protein